MAPIFRYSHPTTPAGTGFDTDLGSVVPWGSISGLTTMAKAGEVGQSSIYIDDPDGTLDIKGLHRFRMVESEADTDPVWNGYIAHQTIGRIGANERFTTGAARSWELALEDDNAILGFRVVWDTDGNRPAETGSARLAWLISTNYLGDVVDDGYVTYPSGTATMDATDYRGQFGKDVLADIALQCGGVNFFAQYNLSTSGTSQNIGLWFGESNESTAFSSTITISNGGDADGTAIFAPSDDTALIRDPSRIAAGVYLPYNGGNIYAYSYPTSYAYAFRDQVAPTATISSQAQATALADQFLATFDEPDEKITTTIWMPPANLYDVRAGHRVPVIFTHLPGYTSLRWARVTQKTIGNFDTSIGHYQVGLELSPQVPPLCTGYDTEWGGTAQGATWSSQDAPNWPTTDFDDPTNAAYDVAGVTHLTAGVTYVGEMWVPLDVDLGSARIVNRLIFDADYNDWNVVVQSSDDGVSYQTVLTEFHILGDPETIDLAAPVQARYWRFLHHWINPDGDGHWHYYGSQMYQYVSLWGCE